MQISTCVFYLVSFLRLFSFPTVVSMGMSRVWMVCVTLPTAAQSVSVLLNFWGFSCARFVLQDRGRGCLTLTVGVPVAGISLSSGGETIKSKSCTNHCFHTDLRMDLHHPQSPGVQCKLREVPEVGSWFGE